MEPSGSYDVLMLPVILLIVAAAKGVRLMAPTTRRARRRSKR